MEIIDNFNYTPLMNAVMKGDLEEVKSLVDMSPVENINQKNNLGDTAFLLAVWYGYTDIAKYLASKGADVNAEYPNGANALCVSVAFNNDDTIIEMINYLLSIGLDPNKQIENSDDPEISFEDSIEGDTSLFVAIRRDNTEVVRLLLLYGANPDIKNSLGDSVLSTSLSMNLINIEIVRMLLEAGADPNERTNFETDDPLERGQSYLFYLISRKEVELVKLFLDYGSDPNMVVDDETPLIYAIKLTESLISAGPYYTQIYEIIFEIIKLLVDHGAKADLWSDQLPQGQSLINFIDQNDKTPLVYSVIPSELGNYHYQPRPELVKYLVDHRAIDYNDQVYNYSLRSGLPYILYLVSKDDQLKIEMAIRYINENNLQDDLCIQGCVSNDVNALIFAKNNFNVQFANILTGKVHRLRDLTRNTPERIKLKFNLRFQTSDVGDRYTLLSLSAFHNNPELTRFVYQTVVNEIEEKYLGDDLRIEKEIFKYYIRQTVKKQIALQIAYERCNPKSFRYMYNILSTFSQRVKNRIILKYLTKVVPCESLMDVMDEFARMVIH